MIRGMRLHNWVRFRGQQELAFDAKLYGVEARTEDDQERSNLVGKSSLVGAIPFALFGWHWFAVDDQWITRGEAEGGVTLVLDGGVEVERTKRRGKSTQLVVRHPGGTAMGDKAEDVVREHVGLSRDDFFASCFFRQKRMSQFVTATSGVRFDIVGGWMGIAPLQDAGDVARRKLRDVRGRRDSAHGLLATMRERHEELGKVVPMDVDALRRALEDARGEVAGLSAKHAEADAAWRRYEGGQQRARLLEQAKRIRMELGTRPSDAELKKLKAAYDDAADTWRAAGREREAKRRLMAGKFDGRCPVGAMPCPVTTELNAKHDHNAKLFERACDAERALGELHTGARALYEERAKREQDYTRKLQEAERLERQAAEYPETTYQPGETRDELVGRLRAAEAKQAALSQQVSQASAHAGLVADIKRRIAKLEAELEAVEREWVLRREAVAVLAAAPRRVSERGLEVIQDGANDFLRDGMGVVARVTWEREADGLSATCDACGEPQPKSVKVRVCPVCGAARGPKQVSKLELELSDRSGAAEDVAGIAFQLSAAAWLRASRGTQWATAVMDEPFGALDEANRRALSRQLASMLGPRFGFRQGFVISHQQGTLDAMPGRVVVVGGADGSVAKVVA